MLTSIPPANRRGGSLNRLSSMRSATRVGMVFVGPARAPAGEQGGRGAGEQEPAPSEFSPRVIAPDAQAQRQRAAYRQALAAKVQQLERLLVEAALPEEAAFWQAELAKLKSL